MLTTMKMALTLGAAVAAATAICPLCLTGAAAVPGAVAAAVPGAGGTGAAQVPDTSSTRMHISGMTCGTCPTTARLALRKVAGVYSAAVTLDDSLGVVRYDPRRVSPARIASELTRLTGYGAKILPDSGPRA